MHKVGERIERGSAHLQPGQKWKTANVPGSPGRLLRPARRSAFGDAGLAAKAPHLISQLTIRFATDADAPDIAARARQDERGYHERRIVRRMDSRWPDAVILERWLSRVPPAG